MREVSSPHAVLVAGTFEPRSGLQDRGGSKARWTSTAPRLPAVPGGVKRPTSPLMVRCRRWLRNAVLRGAVPGRLIRLQIAQREDRFRRLHGRSLVAIRFTDGGSGAIGQVAGVKADDRWHRSFDLGVTACSSEMGIDNRLPDSQRPQLVDNHRAPSLTSTTSSSVMLEQRRADALETTDTTGIAGYNFAVDADPRSGLDETSEGLAVAKQFGGSTRCGSSMCAQDGAGNWGPVVSYPFMRGEAVTHR